MLLELVPADSTDVTRRVDDVCDPDGGGPYPGWNFDSSMTRGQADSVIGTQAISLGWFRDDATGCLVRAIEGITTFVHLATRPEGVPRSYAIWADGLPRDDPGNQLHNDFDGCVSVSWDSSAAH